MNLSKFITLKTEQRYQGAYKSHKSKRKTDDTKA